MGDFIKQEPVFFQGLVLAIVAAVGNVAMSFGANLTADQTTAINAVVVPVLALVLALFARSKVTPTDVPRAEFQTPYAPAFDGGAAPSEPGQF